MKDYFTKIDNSWSYRPVFVVAVLCVVSFFVWSSIAEIDEHVRAVGRVVPSGKTRIIQHLEGGIISEILVNEGQEVKKGDVLFHIKNQMAESDLRELWVAVNALEIKKVRLDGEIEGKEKIIYSQEAEKKYPEIVASERQLFKSRNSQFKESIGGMEKRMHQKVLKLDDLNATASNLRKELSIAQEQLDIKTQLRKKGAVSRSQYLEAVSAIRDFDTRISKTEKEIPITKSEIAELSNLIEENRQKNFSEAGEELSSVKVDIRKLRERIEALDEQVGRTAIRSSVDGVINKLHINTIGGVVQPGGRLAEVIPMNENLVIEGRITTNDRGKIWPKLAVIAQISAYDYTLYGGIEGELDYISANSFIDNQNQEYYQIRVSLDAGAFGKDKPIYPGMTADINIIAGKISILHAILKPFHSIRDKALREM